jgi:hypothetical protein
MSFDTLTLAEIRSALDARPRQSIATPGLSERDARAIQPLSVQSYYDGDHWQAGSGWVGPRPDAMDTEYARVLAEIALAFVSSNKIREVIDRHMHAVIGREPAWSLTPSRALKDDEQPTGEEQALIDEASAALTTWWDGRRLLDALQKAATALLLYDRASVRLFVPPGRTQQAEGRTVVPDADDLARAFDYLYVNRPAPDTAGVITDEDTQAQASVYLYEKKGVQLGEISYANDVGETVLAIVNAEQTEGIMLDIGGLLWLYEMEAAALFTDPLRRLQDQLNMALTMQGRNVIQGGFLERTILNGQMPGEWVVDESAAGGRRFVPSSVRFGGGTTNYIAGVPQRDLQGNVTGISSPSITYRDPVTPATFIESADALKRAILEECHQLHTLISGDATASGESRKQARAEFATSLRATKTALDGCGRWLIETSLRIAAHFAGTPNRYDGLRAIFECRIDTGPLTADEERLAIEVHAAGLIDLEEAMMRVGVDDPAAMKAKVEAEKEANMARAARMVVATPEEEDEEKAPNGFVTNGKPPMIAKG